MDISSSWPQPGYTGEVDSDHFSTHNENFAEMKRLRLSAAILGGLLLAAAAATVLISSQASWSYLVAAPVVLLAVGSIAMVWVIPAKMGSISDSYRSAPLVPALVMDVRPRGVTILALVNRAVDTSAKPQLALVARDMANLTGHKKVVGEKVPCVAVMNNRGSQKSIDRWQFISPMPIAWASKKRSAIDEAKGQIPDDAWRLLAQHKSSYDEVMRQADKSLAIS